MSTNDHKAVARQAFELWNGGGPELARQLFAPDVIVHDPGTPGRQNGIEGELQAVSLYRTAFPDLQFTVEDVFAEGDKVAIRWTNGGTHLGDLMGIPPTGRKQQISGISLMRFEGGRIAEYWVNWDAMGLMQQLGLMQQPEAAPA